MKNRFVGAIELSCWNNLDILVEFVGQDKPIRVKQSWHPDDTCRDMYFKCSKICGTIRSELKKPRRLRVMGLSSHVHVTRSWLVTYVGWVLWGTFGSTLGKKYKYTL